LNFSPLSKNKHNIFVLFKKKKTAILQAVVSIGDAK
jgi:hypothetical protein